MTTTDPYQIKIENFTSNEIIEHPLVVIKGKINQQEGNIIVFHEKLKIIPIFRGSFKFITELSPWENCIEFRYLTTILTLNLYYKPKETQNRVVPLYIICDGHDGRFRSPENEENSIESALKRIFLGALLIQNIFSEKLKEAGMGRKTFCLGLASVFRSKLHFAEARKMSQMDLWYHFAREIMTEFGDKNQKYLAFLSCTNYKGTEDVTLDYGELLRLTEGFVAYGGEGLALLGTACLYTWPENVEEICKRFLDRRKVDKTRFLDDSCYRGTLGGCFATTFGAALHELSHCFNLGHTEEGVMGRGFDNVQNEFLSNSLSEIPITTSLFNCGVQLDFLHKMNAVPSNIFWTKSCSVLLFYHKWFNSFQNTTDYVLNFERNGRFVRSTCGLRVIEIRRKSDELVLEHWIFPDRILKYYFQIPENISYNFELVIVIEDNCGNIFKDNAVL